MRLSPTSYHEAGHCLAELCGLPVTKASVVPSRHFGGQVCYEAPTQVGLRAQTRAGGIAALLGPIAEAQYTGEDVRDVLDRCDGDLRDARRAATTIAMMHETWTPRTRERVFEHLLAAAHRLVCENWQTVTAIAQALQLNGRLAGADIARVIHLTERQRAATKGHQQHEHAISSR